MVVTSKFGLLTIREHSAARKHLFLYPQGDMQGLRKPKRKIKASSLITATTNTHFPKPVSVDLTTKSNLVLIYPIGKDRVGDWSV